MNIVKQTLFWKWIVNTVTSKWARCHLKSLASRLFTQPFIQAQIKEIIKIPRRWPLWEFTGDRWMASNAENFSIWWRHHDIHYLYVAFHCWQSWWEHIYGALPCVCVRVVACFLELSGINYKTHLENSLLSHKPVCIKVFTIVFGLPF